jgi:hypothetical protein
MSVFACADFRYLVSHAGFDCRPRPTSLKASDQTEANELVQKMWEAGPYAALSTTVPFCDLYDARYVRSECWGRVRKAQTAAGKISAASADAEEKDSGAVETRPPKKKKLQMTRRQRKSAVFAQSKELAASKKELAACKRALLGTPGADDDGGREAGDASEESSDDGDLESGSDDDAIEILSAGAGEDDGPEWSPDPTTAYTAISNKKKKTLPEKKSETPDGDESEADEFPPPRPQRSKFIIKNTKAKRAQAIAKADEDSDEDTKAEVPKQRLRGAPKVRREWGCLRAWGGDIKRPRKFSGGKIVYSPWRKQQPQQAKYTLVQSKLKGAAQLAGLAECRGFLVKAYAHHLALYLFFF